MTSPIHLYSIFFVLSPFLLSFAILFGAGIFAFGDRLLYSPFPRASPLLGIGIGIGIGVGNRESGVGIGIDFLAGRQRYRDRDRFPTPMLMPSPTGSGVAPHFFGIGGKSYLPSPGFYGCVRPEELTNETLRGYAGPRFHLGMARGVAYD
jgi:hypothetical protein